MVWCWEGLWVMVFHGNSEDPRIWQDLNDHFSSNSQHRCEHIYIKVRIFLKDHARTLRFGKHGSRRPTSSIVMGIATRSIVSCGRSLAWSESVMHQRSFNKNRGTIFESTELRRTQTVNRSTISFNVRT